MSAAHDLAVAALRRLPAETAHRLTIAGLAAGLGPRARPSAPDPILATRLAGLALPHPLGLAAGFDKDAEVAGAMLAAGFAFVEVGTVTPRPQAGSPRPRLFRLAWDRAVINRMGFNNAGASAMARRWPSPTTGLVGANIGANKDTTDRAGDYVAGLEILWGRPAWFTLNISSPNTPGLRDLQTGGALDDLLGRVAETRAALRRGDRALVGRPDPPLFLKIAPDLTDAGIEAAIEAALRFGIDGLVVGNTTVSRPQSLRSPLARQAGGLSGAPLAGLAAERLRVAHQAAAGRLPLIAAGGIGSAADVLARIRAGAAAVQLYTALVFQGPGIAARWPAELAALLRDEGFRTLAEAVGAG